MTHTTKDTIREAQCRIASLLIDLGNLIQGDQLSDEQYDKLREAFNLLEIALLEGK